MLNSVEHEKSFITSGPGHSDITGNTVTDRLAKAAATEAKLLGEETCGVTAQDKEACQNYSST